MTDLRTERLLLRRWRESDREPFAALNTDPEVMQHFPAPLSRAESDALLDRADAELARTGTGLWAVEAQGVLIGFTGLTVPRPELGLAPSLEVGWRLARAAWGHGYATEAARAALAAAGTDDVVSLTAVVNLRSQAVMRRLGMVRERTFSHPALPPGHRLREHVLFRLPR